MKREDECEITSCESTADEMLFNLKYETVRALCFKHLVEYAHARMNHPEALARLEQMDPE